MYLGRVSAITDIVWYGCLYILGYRLAGGIQYIPRGFETNSDNEWDKSGWKDTIYKLRSIMKPAHNWDSFKLDVPELEFLSWKYNDL